MSLEEGPSEPQGRDPIERPFRWSALWRVFLPLYPWIAIALGIYFVVRLLR